MLLAFFLVFPTKPITTTTKDGQTYYVLMPSSATELNIAHTVNRLNQVLERERILSPCNEMVPNSCYLITQKDPHYRTVRVQNTDTKNTVEITFLHRPKTPEILYERIRLQLADYYKPTQKTPASPTTPHSKRMRGVDSVISMTSEFSITSEDGTPYKLRRDSSWEEVLDMTPSPTSKAKDKIIYDPSPSPENHDVQMHSPTNQTSESSTQNSFFDDSRTTGSSSPVELSPGGSATDPDEQPEELILPPAVGSKEAVLSRSTERKHNASREIFMFRGGKPITVGS